MRSLLPFFLLLICATASAQNSWNRIGGTTRNVAFVDAAVVVAVGDGGKILRSTDAGITWRQPVVPTAEALHAVDFDGGRLGIAVGAGGTILLSEDGGRGWRTVEIDRRSTLRSVDVVDGRIAFAAGDSGTIIRSDDAGRSWRTIGLGRPERYNAIRFFDRSRGMVVGDEGAVLETVNGGDSWTLGDLQTTGDLTAIDLLDDHNGVIVGDRGTALRTVDAGTSWRAITLPVAERFSSVVLIDSLTISAIAGPIVFSSSDGGLVWRRSDIRLLFETPLAHPSFPGFGPVDPYLFGLAANRNGGLVAAGLDAVIVTSSDNGTLWEPVSYLPLSGREYPITFHGFVLLDSMHWFGTSWPGKVFETTDGGATWRFDQVGENAPTFNDIHFSSADSAIIISTGSTTPGALLGSTDGGDTWRSLDDGNFDLISFYSSSGGFGVVDGTIARTIDGGWSWQRNYTLPDGTRPFDIAALDPDHAVMVDNWFHTPTGVGGTAVERTEDGGRTWEWVLTPSTMTNAWIQFIDPSRGWLSGTSFPGGNTIRLYHTSNGGGTWDSTDIIAGTDHVGALAFRGDTLGYMTGSKGTLLVSTDRGRTWTRTPETTLGIDRRIGLGHIRPTRTDELVIAADGFLLRGAAYTTPLSTVEQSRDRRSSRSPMPSLHVLPNPTTGHALIRIEGGEAPLRLRLFDATGSEALDLAPFLAPGADRSTMLLSIPSGTIPAGHYHLRLDIDGSTLSSPLLIVEP